MKIIALIPARYSATRFPGKLLAKLGDKTVITTTFQNAQKTNLFDDVYVITDSKLIYDEILQNGGKSIISTGIYETGSDRIAEVAERIEADIFINIQGDEPFVNKLVIEKLLNVFEDNKVEVASLIQKITNNDLINDPNYVKVVIDTNQYALYFSRSPIPYIRDNQPFSNFYEHIGIYAFRKQSLINFSKWEQTELEKAEKIEALRFLENGVKIKMVITDYMGIEIDTPEDLLKAEEYLNKINN